MVSPKFKKGDKVRLVKKKLFSDLSNGGRPDIHEGDVYTVKSTTYFNGMCCYAYTVVESIYLLLEDEIELVEPEYMTVTFEVKAGDKKAAHKAAHEAVETAYAAWETSKEPVYKDWTDEEIHKAQDAVAKLVHYVVMNGGDIQWVIHDNGITECSSMNHSTGHAKRGFAQKMSEYTYNEWIGKCVSLYHALDIQLPEFIRFKNVKR